MAIQHRRRALISMAATLIFWGAKPEDPIG